MNWEIKRNWGSRDIVNPLVGSVRARGQRPWNIYNIYLKTSMIWPFRKNKTEIV